MEKPTRMQKDHDCPEEQLEVTCILHVEFHCFHEAERFIELKDFSLYEERFENRRPL